MTATMSITTLDGKSLNLADYAFQRFGAFVPAGTTIEDVLHTGYLRNYTHQLKPGAIVTLMSNDLVLDVELLVLTVTKATVSCRVREDRSVKKGHVEAPVQAGVPVVSWGGPNHKWRIMIDGEVLDKGFASEQDAQDALEKVA